MVSLLEYRLSKASELILLYTRITSAMPKAATKERV
jgi:hypothetical protein